MSCGHMFMTSSIIPFDPNNSSDSIAPFNVPEACRFFLSLPRVCSHGRYEADKNAKTKIYAKHRIGHQTLLPGLFTLYCEHGMCMHVYQNLLMLRIKSWYSWFTGVCYRFEVMRVTESPNIAFTLLYTRFQEGKATSDIYYWTEKKIQANILSSIQLLTCSSMTMDVISITIAWIMNQYSLSTHGLLLIAFTGQIMLVSCMPLYIIIIIYNNV